MTTAAPAVGSVSLLRRYPVKSMLGEDLVALSVDELGAAHDRRLALVDRESAGWPAPSSRGCGARCCSARPA